ncbi:MAG: hypothetical protein ACOWWO_01075 [Peptococcaceae bacterium]
MNHFISMVSKGVISARTIMKANVLLAAVPFDKDLLVICYAD